MRTCGEKKLVVAFLLVVLTALGSYGQGNYTEQVNEELYGTWTNGSYDGISPGNYYRPQKVVITPGAYADYSRLVDLSPAASGKEQVVSKWTDSAGNTWYQIQGSSSEGPYTYKFQSLQMLNVDATVREIVSVLVEEYDPNRYPTTVDSKDSSYRIYYRTER
jgi:hypothetical protein